MTKYAEIIKEDNDIAEGFNGELIDMTIDNFVEEYCPHYLYFDYNLYLAQRGSIKGKIIDLIELGNSLMDKEWVEDIIEGYYPKDTLWKRVVNHLESIDFDKKVELFSNKSKFGELVNAFHLDRVKIEANLPTEIERIVGNLD